MVRLTRGERFKDARIVHNQHKKQTMDEVAAATGLQKSLIQALEDDSVNRSVGYDKVAKLAAHYNVSTDYLLGLSDVVSPNTEIRAICDYLGLSQEALTNLHTESKDKTAEYVNALLGYNYDDFHALFRTIMLASNFAEKTPDSRITKPLKLDAETNAKIDNYGKLLSAKETVEYYKAMATRQFGQMLDKIIKTGGSHGND